MRAVTNLFARWMFARLSISAQLTHGRRGWSGPGAGKTTRRPGPWVCTRLSMALMTRTFSGTTLRHLLKTSNLLKMLLPQCRQCEQDVAEELTHFSQVLGQSLNQLVWQRNDRSEGCFLRLRPSGFDLAVGTVCSRRLCDKPSISDRMVFLVRSS